MQKNEDIMAYSSIHAPATVGNLFARVRNFIAHERDAVRLGLKRREIYRETLCELSSLSDRELHDIGVARSDIRYLAMEEARKVTL